MSDAFWEGLIAPPFFFIYLESTKTQYQMTNTPYVKQYNELGECINTIGSKYVSPFKNRSTRRRSEPPFFGNGKNYPMVLIGSHRFKKVLQLIRNEDGSVKKIYHYLPA